MLSVARKLTSDELNALRQWANKTGATRSQILTRAAKLASDPPATLSSARRFTTAPDLHLTQRIRADSLRALTRTVIASPEAAAAMAAIYAARLPRSSVLTGQAGPDKQDPPRSGNQEGSTDRTPGKRSNGGRYQQRRA
jgi:hypothetical protein